MNVHPHARDALVALNGRMPEPASVVLDRLAKMGAPANSTAIEVCQMTMSYGMSSSSNGDSVVVIVRDGQAITAMLRKSWSQPFTPEALRVDEVVSWARHTRHSTTPELAQQPVARCGIVPA